MKSKRIYLIFGVIFFCLCPLIIVIGIGYFYAQDQPPGSLSESGYYIRRTKIFYYSGFGLSSPFEISSADHDSFVILNERYALDTSRVYFEGMTIPDSDPTTFEILDSPFSRDARHVYINGDIFSDDAANYEIVEGNISRDSRHIYWSTEIISDDPSHLVVIGNWDFYTYFKDSTTVFVNGNPLKGANPTAFKVIKDAYSHSASHVFYFNEMIPKVDLVTFEIMESPYARDAHSVFWMENIIPGADPATFQILNAKFECAADGKHAYYENTTIQNADPRTFPPNSTVTNCTKTDIFFYP